MKMVSSLSHRHLGKTYKFQSDWPAHNSQAYLIGALSEDIKADKNATMTEEDDAYRL